MHPGVKQENPRAINIPIKGEGQKAHVEIKPEDLEKIQNKKAKYGPPKIQGVKFQSDAKIAALTKARLAKERKRQAFTPAIENPTHEGPEVGSSTTSIQGGEKILTGRKIEQLESARQAKRNIRSQLEASRAAAIAEEKAHIMSWQEEMRNNTTSIMELLRGLQNDESRQHTMVEAQQPQQDPVQTVSIPQLEGYAKLLSSSAFSF